MDLEKVKFQKIYILRNINYALETNIDVIVDRKPYILQDGAKELTGKECYIYDGKIESAISNRAAGDLETSQSESNKEKADSSLL